MIKVVAIDEDLLDAVIDVVRRRRQDLERHADEDAGRPVADRMIELDAALDALRNGE